MIRHETDIEALAPDMLSWDNALDLAQCDSYMNFGRDMENTMLFGEYAGSGCYRICVDFANPATPVFQCSCPSRKLPCKHALGLLLLYVRGIDFPVAEIPDEVLRQRKNAAAVRKKASGKKQRPENTGVPPGRNRLEAQLNGLTLSRAMLSSLLKCGFGAVGGKTVHALRKQAKQLDSAHLHGVQAAFTQLLNLFSFADTEAVYASVCEEAGRLDALIRRGTAYLQSRMNDPFLSKDACSETEALLGSVWKLDELKSLGLVTKNTRLVQLAFSCFENELASRYEDIGVWIEPDGGRLSLRLNYRPYKAVKHIAADDTFTQAVLVPELCRYPSASLNARIRWEGSPVLSDITDADRTGILRSAFRDYGVVLTKVKEQLRNPLCSPQAYVLASFRALGTVNDSLVIENGSGRRLPLTAADDRVWPETLPPLMLLGSRIEVYSAVLLRFSYIRESIAAVPLALIGEREILKLAY
jgi:hypothetical protein